MIAMPLCDLKKLNKIFKKAGLPSLLYGAETLYHDGIDKELIELLNLLQEALGAPLLLHWNSQALRYDISFFGTRFYQELPKSALQIFHIDEQHPQSAEQKWQLINATENLLDFYQQKIIIKNKKLRTAYENACMRIRMIDLYSEFNRFDKPTSPFQLLHESMLHYLCASNYYFVSTIKPLLERQGKPLAPFDGPWILLAQDTAGKSFSLMGEMQEQLARYVAQSDFLQQYELSSDIHTALGYILLQQSPPEKNMSPWQKIRTWYSARKAISEE